MKSSEYLYGSIDDETARLQLSLFELKKKKAKTLLSELCGDFDLLDNSTEQIDREIRVKSIKKAIDFCDAQIHEALSVLGGEDDNR